MSISTNECNLLPTSFIFPSESFCKQILIDICPDISTDKFTETYEECKNNFHGTSFAAKCKDNFDKVFAMYVVYCFSSMIKYTSGFQSDSVDEVFMFCESWFDALK